jgi:hypothetical protein
LIAITLFDRKCGVQGPPNIGHRRHTPSLSPS